MLAQRLAGPSWSHPLGLDELGRDMLARLLMGARVSLFVGLCRSSRSRRWSASRSARRPGMPAGGSTMRWAALMDVLLAFPGILLAIALVAVLGPSLTNVVLALVVDRMGRLRAAGPRAGAEDSRAGVRPGGARARRAVVARAAAARRCRPRMPAVIVQATLGMAGAIIAEASLSFLGLGVQPPTPSWGTMLDAGRAHLFDAPHLTVFPGVAIALLVLGFNFVGDGLRDRIDRRAI